MVAGPGVTSRGHVPHLLASLIDLPVTCLARAGLDVPADYEGVDLSEVLRGDEADADRVVTSGLGGWRVIADGHYKLQHRYFSGKPAVRSTLAASLQ